MQQSNSLAIAAAVPLLFFLSGILTAEEIPGLVKEKPSKGTFVETDRGYMVPYKTTIPGTDVAFEMVPVPGGKITVGSPPNEAGRDDSEGPQFVVNVPPFWMGKYEVTWDQYKEFMNLYGIFKEFEQKNIRPITDENRTDAITAPTELYDPSFTFEFGEAPRQPAVTMTQYAAKQFTKWISAVTGQFYRLPAEAEWEHACRAGTKTAYHFGDDPSKLGEYAWYYENSDESLHEVGTKKPNPWGLYDMHGSVGEWVLDELLDDGFTRFEGKTLNLADAIVWPTREFPRVVKGGSWDDDAEDCRVASRLGSSDEEWKEEDPNLPLSPWWYTSDPARGVGFRVMRPLNPPVAKDRKKFWEADVEAIKFAVEARLEEGRGALGVVDQELPKAIKSLD